MTVVTEKVARKRRNITRKGRKKLLLQIPCTVSTLRKKVYFPLLTKSQIALTFDEDISDEDDELL